MSPDEARALMYEWVTSEALRSHMEAVAACVGAYARSLAPEQEDRWFVCGLLHDFDYERNPSPEHHPFVGVRQLQKLGLGEEIRSAILGRAEISRTA